MMNTKRRDVLLALVPLSVVFGTCCSSKRPTQDTTRACAALAANMRVQESSFFDRMKAIREQHVLLQEYDRQMIEVLSQHSEELTRLTQADEVSGCFGNQLDELHREAHEEKTSLYSQLSIFKRALITDPKSVYIE